MKKCLQVFAVMVVFIFVFTLQFPTRTAHGLVWAFKNQVYVNTSIVCRDGATMNVTFWNSNGDDTLEGNGSSKYLGARLFTNPDLQPPQETDSPFELDGALYGPELTAPTQITAVYQNGVPFPADLDRDGFKEYNFYVYGADNLLWAAPPGGR